jgi:hypothetical protein
MIRHGPGDLSRHPPNLPGGADVRRPSLIAQRDRRVVLIQHLDELVQHRVSVPRKDSLLGLHLNVSCALAKDRKIRARGAVHNITSRGRERHQAGEIRRVLPFSNVHYSEDHGRTFAIWHYRTIDY